MPPSSSLSKEARAVLGRRAMERFKEALSLAETVAGRGIAIEKVRPSLDAAEAALRAKEFDQALLRSEEAHALIQALEKEAEEAQRLRGTLKPAVERLHEQVKELRAAGAHTEEAEEQIRVLVTALVKAKTPAQVLRVQAASEVVGDLVARIKAEHEQELRASQEAAAALRKARVEVEAARRKAPANLEGRLVEQLKAAEQAFHVKNWGEVRYQIGTLGPTFAEINEHYTRAERAIEKANEMIALTRSRSGRLDLRDAQAKVDEARIALETKDFASATAVRDTVRRSLARALEAHKATMAVKEQAERAVQELVESIGRMESGGFDVRPLDARLEKARAQMLAQDFAGALASAEEGDLIGEGLRSQQQAAAEAILQAKDAIERVAVHSDDRELRDRLAKAEDLLLNRKYPEAADQGRNIRAAADDFAEHAEPALSMKFPPGLKPGIWNRTAIEVTNSGRAHAKHVEVKVKGPLELMGYRPIELLKAGQTTRIELGIKPLDPGDLPIDVQVDGRRASDDKPMAFPATEWLRVAATDKAGAPGSGAAAAAASPSSAAAPTSLPVVEWFAIKELFLIYQDGRLIHRAAPPVESAEKLDDDVWSSMLVAVQSFVQDSFKASGGLDSFEFGTSKVVMQKGQYAILATVIEGREPPMLRDQLLALMEKIEGLYAGVIEKWSGDAMPFKDVEDHMRPVLDLAKRVKMREEKGEVRVMSALEFYQGYVRLKVAVINKTTTTINDSVLRLAYNKTAIRFDHLEPGYPLDGTAAEIGSVKPNEKKTVAFFLDPLICMESSINCTLTYFDFQGKINNLNMKERPVDIVCPIFYTPQTVNTAMLKRLLGEVAYKDTRAYFIKPPLPPSAAFGILKDAILGHQVRFVREFIENNPYHAEAWYYGKTTTGSEELCLMARVRGEDNTIALTVASSNLANLTGLLAELGQNVGQSIEKSEWSHAKLELVTQADLRDSLAKAPFLLDKYDAAATAPAADG